MINNFETLKPLMYFQDDFYMRIMLLSRAKDNGLQKNLQTMFFGSIASLEKELPKLIDIANNKNCRIYIDLIPKRLSTEFLSQIEWERNRVYGIKSQCDKVDFPDYYGLYDADSYAQELNEQVENTAKELGISFIKIPSSEKGEHWISSTSDLTSIAEKINIKRVWQKTYNKHAWACLYNPN